MPSRRHFLTAASAAGAAMTAPGEGGTIETAPLRMPNQARRFAATRG